MASHLALREMKLISGMHASRCARHFTRLSRASAAATCPTHFAASSSVLVSACVFMHNLFEDKMSVYMT